MYVSFKYLLCSSSHEELLSEIQNVLEFLVSEENLLEAIKRIKNQLSKLK